MVPFETNACRQILGCNRCYGTIEFRTERCFKNFPKGESPTNPFPWTRLDFDGPGCRPKVTDEWRRRYIETCYMFYLLTHFTKTNQYTTSFTIMIPSSVLHRETERSGGRDRRRTRPPRPAQSVTGSHWCVSLQDRVLVQLEYFGLLCLGHIRSGSTSSCREGNGGLWRDYWVSSCVGGVEVEGTVCDKTGDSDI